MDSLSARSCAAIDNSFGPYAGGACRGGFDFTQLFEETILTIVPLSFLLIFAPFRIWYLIRRPSKVNRSSWRYIKLSCYASLAALYIASIVLWVQSSSTQTRASVPAAALNFVGSLILALLSYVEHSRSVQPSLILDLWLLLTLLFDVAFTRTLWLQNYNQGNAIISTIAVTFKFLSLVCETKEKQSLLRSQYESYPPEATAGIYNRWAFWWENALFKSGYNNNLAVDDLFALDKHLLSDYLLTVTQQAWRRVSNPTGHALFKSTLNTFKWPILTVVPYRAALIAFQFCQPLLINRAIRLSDQPITTASTQVGYGLIGAYILVYLGIAVTTGQHTHLTYRSITMARGGLISMLYNKAINLNSLTTDPSSSLTLMSADIERITTGWQTMHDLWANMIEVALAIFLLQQQLGAASAIPVGVAILSMFGAGAVTNVVISRQAAWLEAIEKRISATAAMLGAMRGVKMCGLTDRLTLRLQELRSEEMRVSKGFRKLLIYTMAFSYITPVASPILTFAVFSVLARNSDSGATLDTARVFTSLSLFSLLAEPLQSLMMALTTFMGSVGSFARIQEFLQTEEHADLREKPEELFDNHSLDESRKKSTSQGSEISYSKHTSTDEKFDFTLGLQDDHYYFSATDAIVVQEGSLGWDADKAPLLSDININIPREKLTMLVGPVGCGKSTLLKAILGELSLRSGTIQVSSMSVAYCEQKPWHMNCTVRESIIGVVSRFDERWYAQVVEACALDEDFISLPLGDQTSIGSNGVALSGGQSQRIALARAVYAQKDIIILDDVLASLDQETENKVFHNLFGKYGILRRRRATILLASSSVKRVPNSDHVVALGTNGRISEQGNFIDLDQSGGYISTFNLQAGSGAPPSRNSFTNRASTIISGTPHSDSSTSDAEAIAAEHSRRTGDVSVYLYYIKAIGWLPTLVFIMGIIGFVFCFVFPSIWVKWWATANIEDPNGNLGYWLSIYAVIGIGAILCLVLACWQMIISMVPKSGVTFHEKLLKTVLNAPMRFFGTTDTGVTLNRFSQDLQLIDMELPITALNAFAALIMCAAQMILIGVASAHSAIAFPICLIALYIIQKFYLRTSRQLRFLDLEAKSPLYSEFVECIAGLATIRAFGWQDALQRRFRELLDRSQKPFYLLFAVQRWITLILDLMVAAIAVILIVLVVNLRGKLSPGYVGVALLNVIMFSQYIKLLVVFWTMLETHIGAIARIKVFSTDTASEHLPGEDQKPPPSWPSRGLIEFKNVSASYKPPQNVVTNVSLTIQPGHKIAICGRTGSGKSSLVLTLFRMLEQTTGSILVDGYDISTIPRQTVRSRLIGVPQDAYLFPGTVQDNVDPFGTASESDMMDALECVQLWDVVSQKGGLASDVEDCHFSQGQKQLFCLARAMLRPGKVVVLDEATSSIDARTEALIQDVLRTKFAHHTVITVAHKLDSILDFDRVALMEDGQIVEWDAPHLLLEKDSKFAKLYHSSSQQETSEEKTQKSC